MKEKTFGVLLLAMLVASSCTKRSGAPAPAAPPPDTGDAAVVVDCARPSGPVMNIDFANGTSTSSPLPGEATRKWLQGLGAHLVRVWIQLIYVYNKGNIDYDYKYSGSKVAVEDALSFYSSTSDSLLVVMSGDDASASWPLPTGDSLVRFIRGTILHYKRAFPRIKYIEVDNEPDLSGETMDQYYPVYRAYYEAVDEANDSLHLEDNPILMSNAPFTGNLEKMLAYADGFFKAYAADDNPRKRLDFFSFHSYGEANRPAELRHAKNQVDSALQSNGLPRVPVFVSEFGIAGGSGLPSGATLSQTITMQAAGQLTKAFYLYEGGIDAVFNWCVHHGSIAYKSEVADLATAAAYPYGNALVFCKELSDRQTRIQATSFKTDYQGLGIHALAAMGNGKGVAVLVWNYNWTAKAADQDIDVLIRHIPADDFGGKMQCSVYLIDSRHNNYDYDVSQHSVRAAVESVYDYSPWLRIPLTLETSSVALILLTPVQQ